MERQILSLRAARLQLDPAAPDAGQEPREESSDQEERGQNGWCHPAFDLLTWLERRPGDVADGFPRTV